MPEIIVSGVSFFSEERLEIIILFVLGSIGFFLFIIKEKQLIKSQKHRSKIQKDLAMVSKDLTNSYSYIGETNRKLDIIKNISPNIIWALFP